MSARRPSVELSVTLAAVALAVGALLLAGAAPAGASSVGVENTTENTTSTVEDTADDTTETLTSTAEDTTSTVDEATGSTTSTVEDTAETTTSTADSTVNGTTETVRATLDTTAGTLDDATPLDATTISLDGDGLVTSLGEADDGSTDDAATASTTEDRSRSGGEPATRSAGLDHDGSASRPVPDRPGDASGHDGPRSPLPAGAIAVSSVAAGGVALRGFGARWRQPGRVGRRTIGAARTRWRDWLRRLGGLFGYQRYDDSDPLEHGARSDLHEAIQSDDGAYLAELSRETDVPLSTVRYHLRVLEREDLVSSVKHRGKRRYVAAGEEPSALHAALEEDGPAAVVEALEEGGPASVSDLAETLDRTASTVTHHLQRLAEDGVVVREREGGAVVNRLAPGAREALSSPVERAEARAVADD